MRCTRPWVLSSLSVAWCALAVFAGACFPSYEIASGPLPGVDGSVPGEDGAPGAHDGAPATGDGNVTPPDGSNPPPPDGGPPPPPDGAPPPTDSGVPPVAQILVPATPDGGFFAYRDPNDTTTTQSTLTHAFYLDKTELTVGVLRAWIAAQKPVPCNGPGPCTLDPGGPYAQTIQWDPRWNTYTTDELYKDTSGNCNGASHPFGPTTNGTYLDTDDRFPATCINWYIAVSLCWFAGQKRLPTQVEWQYEATGRGAGRTYAWGDTPAPSDCSLAIWDDGNTSTYNGCGFPLEVPAVDGGVPDAQPGRSLDGVLDMTGNVFEWAWDWNDNNYPASWPPDYAGLPGDAGTSIGKSVRGGGWASDIGDLPVLQIHTYDATPFGFPLTGFNDVGVRCAQTKL